MSKVFFFAEDLLRDGIFWLKEEGAKDVSFIFVDATGGFHHLTLTAEADANLDDPGDLALVGRGMSFQEALARWTLVTAAIHRDGTVELSFYPPYEHDKKMQKRAALWFRGLFESIAVN